MPKSLDERAASSQLIHRGEKFSSLLQDIRKSYFKQHLSKATSSSSDLNYVGGCRITKAMHDIPVTEAEFEVLELYIQNMGIYFDAWNESIEQFTDRVSRKSKGEKRSLGVNKKHEEMMRTCMLLVCQEIKIRSDFARPSALGWLFLLESQMTARHSDFWDKLTSPIRKCLKEMDIALDALEGAVASKPFEKKVVVSS